MGSCRPPGRARRASCPSLSARPTQADKRFQLADWRVRPLTSEMLHYARCDTHYLLYCYDRLRVGPPCFSRPPCMLRMRPAAMARRHRAAGRSSRCCRHNGHAAWQSRAFGYSRARTRRATCTLPAPPALQAALLEAGDAVPEGLDVELQAGAQAAAAGGRGALATVLERSRRWGLGGTPAGTLRVCEMLRVKCLGERRQPCLVPWRSTLM